MSPSVPGKRRPPIPPLRAEVGEAELDTVRRIAADGGSGRLSPIELARLLALYQENARKLEETRLVIDSSL